MTLILIPAVLTTKQCHDYVGGSRVWDELLAAHSDILKPFRTVPRGDCHWRRATVDEVILIAEEAATLVNHPSTQPSVPVLKREGRRFKPVKPSV